MILREEDIENNTVQGNKKNQSEEDGFKCPAGERVVFASYDKTRTNTREERECVREV